MLRLLQNHLQANVNYGGTLSVYIRYGIQQVLHKIIIIMKNVKFKIPKFKIYTQDVFYKYWKTDRGADKSLVRPDWKNNWKVAIFHPTRRPLLARRPGWTDNLLNCFWVSC